MNATLKAVVHLGNDYDVNLRHVKKSFWSSAGHLFGETEKLISGQKDSRLISTSSLHSRAHQYATSKVYVFSYSVLCLGKMRPNHVESWKKQIQWYSETNYFSESIELMENLWSSSGRSSRDSRQRVSST